MARRTARMYHHPYDESGQWTAESIDLQVGDRFSTIAPYSEVMMHMNLAGKPIEVEIVSERAAQIYVDGKPVSFPVTLGEAGIYREGRRKVAHRRTARRKVSVNAADVTTGPWDVQVYNEEGPAYSEYGLDGWTAFCSRPVYVNGTHVVTQEVNAGYAVVVVSTDESVNPNRDYPMDPSDFDDPRNPPEGVRFDVMQVVEDRLISASDESELYSDYDYEDAGHPMFFDTFERAMSEAESDARGWQSAPWLRDNDPLPDRYLSYLS